MIIRVLNVKKKKKKKKEKKCVDNKNNHGSKAQKFIQQIDE